MPVPGRAIKVLASFLPPLPPAPALFLSLSSQPLIVSQPNLAGCSTNIHQILRDSGKWFNPSHPLPPHPRK